MAIMKSQKKIYLFIADNNPLEALFWGRGYIYYSFNDITLLKSHKIVYSVPKVWGGGKRWEKHYTYPHFMKFLNRNPKKKVLL